jgi:hypothetical protein
MCGHVLANQYEQRIQKWEEQNIKKIYMLVVAYKSSFWKFY